MRAYETTFILAPSLDAEGFQREVDAIKGVITSNGGEITAEKEWGRRRLAYPIQDQSEGIYHILRFSLEPKQLPKLDRHFKLNENVMRALVIRDGRSYCFRVVGNRVKLVNVSPGLTMNDLVEIKSGLKEGDRVVLKPPAALKNGSRVKVKES